MNYYEEESISKDFFQPVNVAPQPRLSQKELHKKAKENHYIFSAEIL